MALEFLTGRRKSGKSQYIFNEIKRLTDAGEQAILIVPEQFTHAAEKKLLAVVNAIRDNCVEITSFERLAQVTERRLGFPETEKIDSVGKAIILDRILKNGDFRYFRGVCQRNGFTDLCMRTISEFKKYMLTPQILIDASQNTDDEVLAMKLLDMSEIYQKYEDAINQKYTDSDDLLTVLANRIENAFIYNSKHIFFDEFSSFVPQEISVIKAFVQNAKSVTMSFCYDSDDHQNTLFLPTKDTMNAIEKACGKAKVRIFDGSFGFSDGLKYIEKNLYSFPPQKFTTDSRDVTVFAANNTESEVERVAANICELIFKNNYRYKEIGIICSDIPSYSRHIERIFNKYSIPYFMDAKNDVLNHHIIRFVLNILDVYLDEYSYASIFNYLKTGFLSSESDNICILETFIKKTGLRKSSWLDDDRWNNLLNRVYPDNENIRNSLCSVRDKFIFPLANMHNKIKGRNKVRDNLKELYNLLIELGVPQTIEKYIQKFTDENEVILQKEYKQVWEVVVNSFDRVAYLCGDDVVNVASFKELLVTAFSQYSIGFIPSSVDRILIGNTERTKADGIKVLFVLGVNEGIFPLTPKPDGILGDAEKENLKSMGIDFSTTSKIAAYYSQFAAYTAFTMPTEKLCISYAKAANDGKTMRRSYIISRICKLMHIAETSEKDICGDNLWKITNKNACAEYLAENMSSYMHGSKVDNIWKNVYNYYNFDPKFVDRLNDFSISKNIAQTLDGNLLDELTNGNSTTSVSRLQRYSACRYSYFLDYILHITQEKQQSVDSIDIGNITHYILENLCREAGELSGGFAAVDAEFAKKEIDIMLGKFLKDFDGMNDEFSPRNKYVISRLKDSLLICFEMIKKQIVESKFVPLGYEIEFKNGSDLGTINIELDNGKTVYLTGKIDRADIYESQNGTFVRIIDYKTGSKSFNIADVFYGLDVQLVVYLDALVKSNPNYTYGGALYFMIDNPIAKSDRRLDDECIRNELEKSLKISGMISEECSKEEGFDKKMASLQNKYQLSQFNLLDQYINHLLKELCTGIADGDISINPYRKNDYSPCDYCNYRSVCRFDTINSENDFSYKPSINKKDVWEKMRGVIDGLDN